MSDPLAVILCKFLDDSSEPQQRKWYEMLFTHVGAGTDNLPQYFRDISHGHFEIDYSQVFGWYTLKKKASDYTGSGANPAGRNELIQWARDAATANGVDLGPFGNRIVVCINRVLETYGGGAGAVLDAAGMEPYVAGQEILHTLSLDHAREEGKGDYTDPWDVMSAMNSRPTSDPLWGRVGPVTNAANMESLGWLDSARVWQAPSSTPLTPVTLRPLTRPDLNGHVAAKIGDYYAEFRIPEGWDAGIGNACVLVHSFSQNHSYLMHGTGGQVPLSKGDSFLRKTADGALVTITVDDLDAANHVAN